MTEAKWRFLTQTDFGLGSFEMNKTRPARQIGWLRLDSGHICPLNSYLPCEQIL